MIVRCTQKLAKKLKLGRLDRTNTADAGSVWYAALFRVELVQYIILTEAITLGSILLPGRGIKGDLRGLDERRHTEAILEAWLGSCPGQRYRL
jgi:hypothetical protein